MPAPLASWNPARDAWETSHSHIDLFSGLSAVYSETFPSWGMWADGVAYELPTSAHLTDASASSSSPGLLPTPTTQDGANTAGPSQFDRNSLPLNVVATLLPTPRATDGTKGGPNQRGSSGDLMLPSAVMLLPTPTAMDSAGSRNCTAYRGPNAKAVATGTTLTDWLWLHEGWTTGSTQQPSDDGSAA